MNVDKNTDRCLIGLNFFKPHFHLVFQHCMLISSLFSDIRDVFSHMISHRKKKVVNKSFASLFSSTKLTLRCTDRATLQFYYIDNIYYIDTANLYILTNTQVISHTPLIMMQQAHTISAKDSLQLS